MISRIARLRARSNPWWAAQFGTAAYENISSSDLQKLNRTSAGLYRILLRESKMVTTRLGEHPNGKDLRGNLLLQPPVDHKEYGRTRRLKSSCTSWRPLHGEGDADGDEVDKTKKIVAFFRRWGMSGSAEIDDGEVVTKGTLDATKLMLSHIPASYEHLIPPKNKWDDSDGDSDEEEKMLAPYQCIIVSPDDLVNAVRSSFLRVGELSDQYQDEFKSNLTKNDIVQLQRRAIDAVPVLNEQFRMCDCTSVAVNEERGLRVIATSRFTGTGPPGGGGLRTEHMFVYRIRIENIGRSSMAREDVEDEARSIDGDTVQLLGRTWIIRGNTEGGDDDYDDDPQVVNAPNTGVVGYHPVLKPGESFEYMSGCTISSFRGSMSGSFHMAVVDDNTKSAQVGDALRAFDYDQGDDRLFEVSVATFALEATNE